MAEGDPYVLPRMIVALRELAGVNQSQLAVSLGVSPSAVNQVEKTDTALQEGVFVRYTRAIGYPDELAALKAGVAALSEPVPAPPGRRRQGRAKTKPSAVDELEARGPSSRKGRRAAAASEPSKAKPAPEPGAKARRQRPGKSPPQGKPKTAQKSRQRGR